LTEFIGLSDQYRRVPPHKTRAASDTSPKSVFQPIALAMRDDAEIDRMIAHALALAPHNPVILAARSLSPARG
jgi:hypothetical protein